MVLLHDLTPRQAAGLLNVTVTAYTTRVSRLRRRITKLHADALSNDDVAVVRDPT